MSERRPNTRMWSTTPRGALHLSVDAGELVDQVIDSVASPLLRRLRTLMMAMRITFNGWLISWARPVAISPRVADFRALGQLLPGTSDFGVVTPHGLDFRASGPCSSNTPRSDQTHQACSRPGNCRLISAVNTLGLGSIGSGAGVNDSRCCAGHPAAQIHPRQLLGRTIPDRWPAGGCLKRQGQVRTGSGQIMAGESSTRIR